MTQEDKDLLLKDLCARLPYHPIVSVAYNYADKGIVWGFDVLRIKLLLEIEEEENWEYIKPYIRPMSSMTEDEKETYYNLCYEEEREELEFGEWAARIHYHDTIESIDYLNSIHADYRELIPKGLALEAPEDMYK